MASTGHWTKSQDSLIARASKSSSPYKTVNKRDVLVKVRADWHTCSVEGVCQLPDGSIVVADSNNYKLKKLDRSFKVTCYCTLPANPMGVCHVDGNTVAVALENKTVQFVSVGDSMAKVRSLSLTHDCRGVAHHQGRLYVTSSFGDIPALHVYSLSGSQLQVYTKDQNGKNLLSNPQHVALNASGNIVYVADANKGLVTMDTNGHLLGSFTSDLKNAFGVCVANNGSVFVGGKLSHNVIQVGEEGSNKLADVVDPASGLIKKPMGLCFDKRGSRLFVGPYDNDHLAMFDMTQ